MVSDFGHKKKKSFRDLVGTNRSAFQLWDSFMIRIANEESNCLSSFVILTMTLITMLIKEVPELECRPIVPT